jgi:CBS domain-containing protein
MKTVADIFTRKGSSTISVSSNTNVFQALKIMSDHNIGSVVIMDDTVYLGLFTERDYARKVILHGKNSSELTVIEIMSASLPRIERSTTLDECMQIMTSHNIRYLPVFEADQYIGVISIIDVVKETITQQQETIENLQNYIHFAG